MKKSLYFLLLIGFLTPQLSAMDSRYKDLRKNEEVYIEELSGFVAFFSEKRPRRNIIKKYNLRKHGGAWIKLSKDQVFSRKNKKKTNNGFSDISSDTADKGYLILTAYMFSVPHGEKQDGMKSLKEFCLKIGDDSVAKIIPSIVSTVVQNQYKSEKESDKLNKKVNRTEKRLNFFIGELKDLIVDDGNGDGELTIHALMNLFGVDLDTNDSKNDRYFNPKDLYRRIKNLETTLTSAFEDVEFDDVEFPSNQKRTIFLGKKKLNSDISDIEKVRTAIQSVFGKKAVEELKKKIDKYSNIKKPLEFICKKFSKDYKKSYKKYSMKKVLKAMQKHAIENTDNTKEKSYRILRSYYKYENIAVPEDLLTNKKSYSYYSLSDDSGY